MSRSQAVRERVASADVEARTGAAAISAVLDEVEAAAAVAHLEADYDTVLRLVQPGDDDFECGCEYSQSPNGCTCVADGTARAWQAPWHRRTTFSRPMFEVLRAPGDRGVFVYSSDSYTVGDLPPAERVPGPLFDATGLATEALLLYRDHSDALDEDRRRELAAERESQLRWPREADMWPSGNLLDSSVLSGRAERSPLRHFPGSADGGAVGEFIVDEAYVLVSDTSPSRWRPLGRVGRFDWSGPQPDVRFHYTNADGGAVSAHSPDAQFNPLADAAGEERATVDWLTGAFANLGTELRRFGLAMRDAGTAVRRALGVDADLSSTDPRVRALALRRHRHTGPDAASANRARRPRNHTPS